MNSAIIAKAAVELGGTSAAVIRVRGLIQEAAASDTGVLITSQPGVLIDDIVDTLHACGPRAAQRSFVVECHARDAATIDHLLFGAAPDAAAGDLEAVASDSVVSRARSGTLWLRDVTELPAAVQAKLARIARDGEVYVDGDRVALTWRLVASAPLSIDADVYARRFRSDLYRRLSEIRIDVPALGDRPEDIPAIAQRLLEDLCDARNMPVRSLTHAALALVAALPWPGNAAELKDALDRVLAQNSDPVIQIEHLLAAVNLRQRPAAFMPDASLRHARERFERDYISAVLRHHGGRMGEAAQTLGIQRPNLYRKARQLGIRVSRQ
jgi:DNA-binding NtrC family response regulator